MSKLIINKELLISLVKARPVLWDRNSGIYRDKGRRNMAWQEILASLRKDFDAMDSKERHEYGKLVIKTWSQLRDCWVRSLNDRRKGKLSRPYIYHRHLLFLKKVTKHESLVSDSEEEEEMRNKEADPVNTTNKRTTNETDIPAQRETNERIFQMIVPDNQQGDRHYAFFKSIQPSLALLNDDQVLQFQSSVITLLQGIKSGNNYSEWQHPSSSSHWQPHGYYNPRDSPSIESDYSEDPFQESKFDINEDSK